MTTPNKEEPKIYSRSICKPCAILNGIPTIWDASNMGSLEGPCQICGKHLPLREVSVNITPNEEEQGKLPPGVEPIHEDIDESLEELACGKQPDGTCTEVGSEFCEFRCPYRK